MISMLLQRKTVQNKAQVKVKTKDRMKFTAQLPCEYRESIVPTKRKTKKMKRPILMR
jgi:hypothetical protein